MANRFSLAASIEPSVDERAAEREADELAGTFEDRMGNLAPGVEGGGVPGGAGAGAGAGGAAGAAGIGSMLGGGGGLAKVALGGAVGFGLLSGIQKVAQASPAFQQTSKMFNDAMQLFFRPFGSFLSGILRPATMSLMQMGLKFNKLADEDGLSVAIGKMYEGFFVDMGKAMADNVTGDWDLTDFIPKPGNMWADMAQGFWEALQEDFPTLDEWWDAMIEESGADKKSIWSFVKAASRSQVKSIWNWIRGPKSDEKSVWEWITIGPQRDFWKWVDTQTKNLWQWIKTNTKNVWNWITTKGKSVWDWISTQGKIVWDWIKTKPKSVWNWIKTKPKSVWDWIDTKQKSVWDWIDTKQKSVWDWIDTKQKSVWDWIKTKPKNVWDWIKHTAKNVWNWIKHKKKNVWTWIKTNTKKLWTWIDTPNINLWDNVDIPTINLGNFITIPWKNGNGDPCDGITCEPGKHCVNGNCVPTGEETPPPTDPCAGITCDDPGEVCKDGQCVPIPGYEPPGGGCFPAGTPVQTPYGTKPIEKVQPDDQVVSCDPVSGDIVTSTVGERVVHTNGEHDFAKFPLTRLHLTVGGDVETTVVTANHRYLVSQCAHNQAPDEERWKHAGNLQPGDVLRAEDEQVEVLMVRAIEETPPEAIYNLHMESGPPTYLADGVVVHNEKGGDTKRTPGGGVAGPPTLGSTSQANTTGNVGNLQSEVQDMKRELQLTRKAIEDQDVSLDDSERYDPF